ncbi:MAG: FecR/PupR family sigma factor regulator [Nitrospira sp.]
MQCTGESGDMFLSERQVRLRNEAVAWVIRLHNEQISQEDRRTFDVWHAQSPAHALMFGKILAIWNSSELRAAAATAAEPEPISCNMKTGSRR